MTDLIKLAEECDAQIHETVDRNFKKGPDFIVFLPEQLQQFAQRYRAMVLEEARIICVRYARQAHNNSSQNAAFEIAQTLQQMAEVQNVVLD